MNLLLTFVLASIMLWFVSSCTHNISPPVSVVAPAQNQRPYIILTADRSVVKCREKVNLFVTVVNPTKNRILTPTESAFEIKGAPIAHNLVINWKGINGDSSTVMSYNSISTSPPNLNYIEPGKSKSYRLSWNNSFTSKGIASIDLTLQALLSEFTTVRIIIATE